MKSINVIILFITTVFLKGNGIENERIHLSDLKEIVKNLTFQNQNTTYFPDPKLNITDYMTALNYPWESHDIVTNDGYILTFFRLQAKNSKILPGLPVVYWQHGFLDSSDLTVMNSEDKAPAFILANAGYDVWLGNSRGNWHSKRNIHISPEFREFWQFTWQDMATGDLPAAFDYITKYTNQPKINYVGHSQGTMIMHAALVLGIPSVVNKVNKIISTGPVAYLGNVTSLLLQEIGKNKLLYPVLDSLGYWDFLPADSKLFDIDSDICGKIPQICGIFIRLLMDLMPSLDNIKERAVYMTNHFPCGTSLKNMNHLQQLIATDKFQFYDYETPEENMKYYNQTTPPQLDLSKITHDIHLLAGDTDEAANPVDVVKLYNGMQNSKGKTIKMFHMGHATFLIGKNMKYMNDLINILQSN